MTLAEAADRRARVQADRRAPAGTIPWSTHLAAWEGYAAAGHGDQSAETVADRGGFSYREVQCAIAGHFNEVASCKRIHLIPTGWLGR
jgi:hypothetical protein